MCHFDRGDSDFYLDMLYTRIKRDFDFVCPVFEKMPFVSEADPNTDGNT